MLAENQLKKTQAQACQIHAKALDEVTQHLYLVEVPTRSPKTRARTEKGDGHDALCPVHKSRPVDGFENLAINSVDNAKKLHNQKLKS